MHKLEDRLKHAQEGFQALDNKSVLQDNMEEGEVSLF